MISETEHKIKDIENIQYPFYFKHDFSSNNRVYCIYGVAVQKDFIHYITEKTGWQYGHFHYEISKSDNDYTYYYNKLNKDEFDSRFMLSNKIEFDAVRKRAFDFLNGFYDK